MRKFSYEFFIKYSIKELIWFERQLVNKKNKNLLYEIRDLDIIAKLIKNEIIVFEED